MERHEQNNSSLGIALILSAMFVFATQDALTKTLVDTYSAPQILLIRFSFYILFALAYAKRRKPLRQCLKSAAPWLQIARSLLIVAEIGMFIVSIRFLSLAEMHSLFATFPLMVTAIAALFMGEKVGIRRWAAVFVGFLGVLVILRPGFGELKPGVLFALLTAFMFAVYNVLTRLVARYDDSETSMVYMGLIGFVTMTFIGPFFWIPPTQTDWLLLLALSISGTAGHFLLIKALEAAPASTLQPFNYTMLVFAGFYGWAVFDNIPDVWTITGSAIVVASGLYVIYRERRRAKA